MSNGKIINSGNQRLVRAAWIEACHFHDLNEKQVLDLVSQRVHSTSQAVVLFDLDSTLYEVGPRTHQILREWCESPESRDYPQVAGVLKNLKKEAVGYSLNDTFQTLGLDVGAPAVASVLKMLKPFWVERFFTSKYLSFDHAYPGAADFVKKVYQMGAQVVYLTGRDEPGMGDGTRQNLIRDGFPWKVERTHLLLKPTFNEPDLEHKVNAGNYIKKHGTLIASFENEPANIAALHEVFPDAMHVFVDTVYSDHGALPRQGLYRINGFEHSPT